MQFQTRRNALAASARKGHRSRPSVEVLEERALLAGGNVINFDDLPAGTIVTNQYPIATFSGDPAFPNQIIPSTDASQPNSLGAPTPGGPAGNPYIHPLYVDFSSPVNALRFLLIRDDDSGKIAEVRVFERGTNTATVPMIGDGNNSSPNLVDLSAYHDITRIEIVNITDRAGLLWDDFTFDASEVKVQTVHFAGSGMTPIAKDDGSVVYTDPIYFDANLNGSAADPGDHMDPVTYVRGSTATVSAQFKLPVPNTNLTSPIKVRGTGPSDLNVPETVATLDKSDNQTIDLAATALSAAFGSHIDVFEPMTIDWEISYNDGKDWQPAGSSQNPVYVTLATPQPDPISSLLYHTVVRLSSLDAKGATSESAAIPKIFGEFTDHSHSVTTVDGRSLAYYGDYRTQNVLVSMLLASGVGQCGSFNKLFLDMLKAQGIQRPNDYVTVVPNNGASGFIVNAWKFGTGHSGNAIYPYIDIPDAPFPSAPGYPWRYADVTRDAGSPNQAAGQGNPDPASLFSIHQIALIDGVYYDASYGLTYSSLDDMDSKAIAGYYQYRSSFLVKEASLGVDLNGNGTKTDILPVVAYLFRKNDPSVGELKVGSSITY